MNMLKYIRHFVILLILCHPMFIRAQENNSEHGDSLALAAHKGFDDVSKLHRIFFGENYRKEWSAATKLPVIRLSEFQGGLVITKAGGGNQTRSLRLEDRQGREWVMRSVEKYPEAILPEELKRTFVKDVVTDAMSAQHPYAALAVPPIANAVGVPHTDPIIGIIAPDSVLGSYSKEFAGTICLLEEREPGGKTDNYFEMLDHLNADNDNNLDSTTFLKARILDVFLGDWDRHKDQWRFRPEKSVNGIKYVGIPRDRDQVFYTSQGVFPWIESRPYIQPFFEGFNPKIRNAGTLLFSSTMMNVRFLNQFSYEEWMRITNDFAASLTDSVLELAIRQLPKSSYDIRRDRLLRILKSRRGDLPRAMSDYYFFLNKNVFIQTSDRNEFIEIKDTLDHSMQVSIFKLSMEDKLKQSIFSKTYDPAVTKEIRFFVGKGSDSIVIENKRSDIRLRFSGKEGIKKYNLLGADHKVAVHAMEQTARFYGDESRFKKYISNDSLNTAILPGNLFNVFTPLLNIGYNPDDGVLLGMTGTFSRGLDYTTSSFSTKKYTSFQQFGFRIAFATKAFEANYHAEWVKLFGRMDFLVQASVFAPNSTQNYFGTGNETPISKSGEGKSFYRSRFSLYKLSPSLRWRINGKNSFSIGPSLEYYTYDSADNAGRYIETTGAVQSYDSVTLSDSRLHGGIILDYLMDSRDNRLLPSQGGFIHLKLQGYAGLNTHSESFAQFFVEGGFYKTVDANDILVIADRVGGGATMGNAAFYQSMFIGGQGSLLGYRKNRFAGQYMAYNNLEARLKLATFNSYILPGQLGLIGLYDIGRVWQKEDHSNEWHSGVGGGFYFAPAQLALFQCVVSYSSEGWYPTLALGFRF